MLAIVSLTAPVGLLEDTFALLLVVMCGLELTLEAQLN